ncbi:hypothetical protein D6D26_03661 [Aureobasidium pullulans]|nr:hypothetical protein D6D26_03661 [Aureobasidium pullulans]
MTTSAASSYPSSNTTYQLHTNSLYHNQILTTVTMVYTLVVHLYAKEDQESINKLIAKLQEASQVYTNDKECLGWFVMQDTKDPRAFTIVERYAHESSQKYHLENPYWQTFDKYVIPLLAKDMDLRRLNELVDDNSEQVRVEQDPKLWEEVKKHQTY